MVFYRVDKAIHTYVFITGSFFQQTEPITVCFYGSIDLYLYLHFKLDQYDKIIVI